MDEGSEVDDVPAAVGTGRDEDDGPVERTRCELQFHQGHECRVPDSEGKGSEVGDIAAGF